MKRYLSYSATVATILFANLAFAPSANAITVAPAFASDYTATDLGSISGLPTPYGGLTLLAGNTDTLLIGGAANTAAGNLYTIGVTRDLIDLSITGFSGTPTPYGAVGEYNDGGVTYGPGGVLFTSQWPVNQLGQTKPGSVDEDRVDDLAALGIAQSHSAINFVPAGFAGAGKAKIVSWSGGQWYDLDLVPDGSGTFNPLSATQVDLDLGTAAIDNLPGGPEGFVYIADENAGFSVDSMLVSDFSLNRVSAYELDGDGNPLISTRLDFLTDLNGAEGAFIDPLTGDFLFSTFRGSNQLVRVDGFIAPPAVIPVPAAVWLFGTALVGFIGMSRRRKVA